MKGAEKLLHTVLVLLKNGIHISTLDCEDQF